MLPATVLRDLAFERAVALVDGGAAFADLRPSSDYLDVHIPGSLALVYEAGPGMAARARDCLPLSLPLVLVGGDESSLANAAAALRGKGFTVLGHSPDGLNAWASASRPLASTEVVSGGHAPEGVLLDVGDPGAGAFEDAIRIPIETLWNRVAEIEPGPPVVVGAGYGVRAGLAVGMLERAGHDTVVLWRSI